MYWSYETTRANVERYVDMLVARIAARPRRLQRDLDLIASIWSGPPAATLCLGGRTHWQVPATADAVAAVAAHATDPVVGVRHAVAAALMHAAPHVDAALPALRTGLVDTDPRVRLLTARAIANGLAVPALRDLLVRAGVDVTWSVRWHAAVALDRLGAHDDATGILLASVPRPGLPLASWLDAARHIHPDAALIAVITRARIDYEVARLSVDHPVG